MQKHNSSMLSVTFHVNYLLNNEEKLETFFLHNWNFNTIQLIAIVWILNPQIESIFFKHLIHCHNAFFSWPVLLLKGYLCLFTEQMILMISMNMCVLLLWKNAIHIFAKRSLFTLATKRKCTFLLTCILIWKWS